MNSDYQRPPRTIEHSKPSVSIENLELIQKALDRLPRGHFLLDEAIEKIYPGVLAAFRRGASTDSIFQILQQYSLPLTASKWDQLVSRLQADRNKPG